MKKWQTTALAYGVPLIGFIIYWYFSLTPLTFQSLEFWINLFIYFAISAFLAYTLNPKTSVGVIRINGVLMALGVLALLVGSVIGLPIFRSKDYAGLITHEEGNFEEDVSINNPNQIPTIDRDMAERLGSRKIGEVLDLVSQFNVADEFTQISYQGESVRVSPLEYVNAWRWFSNRSDGIPHYVSVNMVTGEADLVDLDETIRYSHSGLLNDDISRHIFLRYPTTLFEKPAFEVDETGHPYYIAPIVERQFSFFGPKDVVGAFVVDAATGDIEKYDLAAIPEWVDRVFPAELIMDQINYNGQYQSGYWNSVITKRGVIQNAEGYNYLVMNDDLYLYTGITSVASDESNIGFLLVNSRTKESYRYNISTATEWSAMESAEGSVQEKEYQSTFPLLFNMNGKPVYQLSLKDSAGLIKLYAFVDALNYQRVGVGNSLQLAWNAYNGETVTITDEADDDEIVVTEEVTGEISAIEAVVINGETHYYFTLDNNLDLVYAAKVSLYNQLPFIKAGDRVILEVEQTNVRSIQLTE
ncbi:hypothetical protein [Jeotgalibaca arthritidis]|uniref:CvpA family protein n=1 Tax=Jeotgalibaca arthritidis TaxID=1868794 RepID=A0A6G7K7G5_9LACT|nr:hypothetical protein [Jeotgalibaca arthritidis]QII81182.1 hypothetical protein G7057_00975 [Jeotgalibaca arthritidis]